MSVFAIILVKEKYVVWKINGRAKSKLLCKRYHGCVCVCVCVCKLTSSKNDVNQRYLLVIGTDV